MFSPKWLNEEKLVQRLTELIHTGDDEEASVPSRCTLTTLKVFMRFF